MIPRRVCLKGFLCYKEEQTIDFDGTATLWMLSGLNGSGKSAIFDAVTYALFGYHRGGSLHAHELINKESDTMAIEFDFLLDGKEFRAKRTLKRDTKGGARGTQQMFRWDAGKGSGRWEAVEGTGQRREFEAWVKENVGLEYDTFTSSVLLLQGKAEKLLDSRPEGRREVLASIVDLGRYERLHLKADERRKSLEGALKSLTGRLAAVPAITPIEMAEARARITEAEEARDAARAEVERLGNLNHQAQTWHELKSRLEQARRRLDRAKGVLADATAIEKAIERLRELRDVYPRLREMVLARTQAAESEEKITRLTEQKARQGDELTTREAAVRQAREKRAAALNQITRDETSNREVADKLSQAKVKLEKLAECERYETERDRLKNELGKLPADPQGMLSLAREEYERLEALARVVPLLVRFSTRRQDLALVTEHERQVEKNLQEVRARAEARKKEAEELRPKLEHAKEALEQANEQATEARTLLTQAKQSLDELSQLDGAKVCRHCGQTLTDRHLTEEKQRRAKALAAAQERSREADDALKSAKQQEKDLRQKVEASDKFVQTSRDEYRDNLNQQKQAKLDVERARNDCATLYDDLPEDHRRHISPTTPADWLDTEYPALTDIDELKKRANGVASARQKKTQAEDAVRQYDQIKARETVAQENLTRLLRDLPKDRAGLRKDHAELEATSKALFKSIDGGREQVKSIDREIEKLSREHEDARKKLAETEGKLTDERLRVQMSLRSIATQMAELPATWKAPGESMGIRELDALNSERDQLERAGTDDRARELQAARHSLSEFNKDVTELEAKEAAHPAEAKQELKAIESLLKEAKVQDKLRDEDLSKARKQYALLESYEQQRRDLDRDYRATEKELITHRLVCELLGRERLQLFLVRQAERQVVEYANAVLDRLSGGQLYLRLTGDAGGEGTSAKALELEAYNRMTGEKPINVAFLSGSQKFRVAVSLALGIGQYASRQHRPIESVIIDEGFGCLDSQGRQVMIQELQNLRSQMRCILLVSHQEDFADAFSDGYHFQLEQGATRVKRVQK